MRPHFFRTSGRMFTDGLFFSYAYEHTTHATLPLLFLRLHRPLPCSHKDSPRASLPALEQNGTFCARLLVFVWPRFKGVIVCSSRTESCVAGVEWERSSSSVPVSVPLASARRGWQHLFLHMDPHSNSSNNTAPSHDLMPTADLCELPCPIEPTSISLLRHIESRSRFCKDE